MTLEKIHDTDLIDNQTEIYVMKNGKKLARGKWYQDDVVNYIRAELTRVSWYDNGALFAELK